ncbi:MAG: RtcB family protein [Stappiaceae bacterium]
MTGKDLIAAGCPPGKYFKEALPAANAALARGEDWLAVVRDFMPPPSLPLHEEALPFHRNIEADDELEEQNVAAAERTMAELMRTPVLKYGAVMPDACPAGPNGTIPVGGVAASEAIHPGMHSADICCSMMITIVGVADPRKVLDAGQSVTHFGGGGREVTGKEPSAAVLNEFSTNRVLKRLPAQMVKSHFATQGDGNHFFYVGQMASTGETAIVTHHGSRGPGARLYKEGMGIAESFRRTLSPETLKQNAWIPAETEEGENYWAALQTIRQWTKESHAAIHDLTLEAAGLKPKDRFWNEHNFVFRKSDGLFYHAKGATPAFDGWATDATDLTIIPLNMSEPVLIVRGKNADNGLGFSPHGAGRNLSRTAHKRGLGDRPEADILAEETNGLDVRFFSGVSDVTELPSAYKSASAVRRQIDRFELAEVVDEVIPYGSIMAGDWQETMPWRQKRKAKAALKND